MKLRLVAVILVVGQMVGATACGGGGGGDVKNASLTIMTAGGAGYGGNIAGQDIELTGKDQTIKFKTAPGDTIVGTITRHGNRGEVYVRLDVSGQTLFEDVANNGNHSVNVVVEVPENIG